MTLVFLLEEPSMKHFLDAILPKILPENIAFRTIAHEGKRDLEKSIPHKLKAWNEPNVKFVIVHDQDSWDCKDLKAKLLKLCEDTGKECLVRIACHELESWYLGDLNAIYKTYGKKLKAAKFENPDKIANPKQEFLRLFPKHQQISGAKKIAEFFDAKNNKSKSFQVFLKGVEKMAKT